VTNQYINFYVPRPNDKSVITIKQLGARTCSESNLTAETIDPFRYFGRTPWTGDRPIAQDDTTQRNGGYI